MGFLSNNSTNTSSISNTNTSNRRWIGKPAIRAPMAAAAKNVGLMPTSIRNSITKKQKKKTTKKAGKSNYLIIDDSDRTEETAHSGSSEVESHDNASATVLSQQQQQHESLLRKASSESFHSHRPSMLSSSTASSSNILHKEKHQPKQQRRSRSHSQSRRSRSHSSQQRPKTRSPSRPQLSHSRKFHHPSPGKAKTITTKAIPTATPVAVAIDSQGRCPHHPFVQLQRLSKRTKEWKTLLDSCPLCAAMDDDDESIASESSVSSSSSSPKSPTHQKLQHQQQPRQEERSHSQSRSPLRRSQSHSQARSQIDQAKIRRLHSHDGSLVVSSEPQQRSRSYSNVRSRTSPRQHRSSSRSQSKSKSRTKRSSSSSRLSSQTSRRPYYTSQKVEGLRRDGFRSMDKFECSTETIVTGNMHHYCSSGINNNNGVVGTARAASPDGSADGQEEDYHDDVKIVRFADEKEQGEQQKGAARHSSSLVTQVHTRPYTTKLQKPSFFHSAKDVRQFRRWAMLEILSERASSSSSSASAAALPGGSNVDYEDGEEKEHDVVAVDTPLLHRLLFDDDIDYNGKEEEVSSLPEDIQDIMLGMDHIGMDDHHRRLTLQSRNHRGVRKFLHREAILYHL